MERNTRPNTTTTSTLPKPTSTTTATSTTTTSTTDTNKHDEELADQFAKQMADLLKTFQSGDLEKNIEEIVKNIGLKLPEDAGGSSSGGTEEDREKEAADLSTILSAFAQLDAEQQGGGQGTSTSTASESVASKISDRLKEIAENAKNKGVCQPSLTFPLPTLPLPLSS